MKTWKPNDCHSTSGWKCEWVTHVWFLTLGGHQRCKHLHESQLTPKKRERTGDQQVARDPVETKPCSQSELIIQRIKRIRARRLRQLTCRCPGCTWPRARSQIPQPRQSATSAQLAILCSHAPTQHSPSDFLLEFLCFSFICKQQWRMVNKKGWLGWNKFRQNQHASLQALFLICFFLFNSQRVWEATY